MTETHTKRAGRPGRSRALEALLAVCCVDVAASVDGCPLVGSRPSELLVVEAAAAAAAAVTQ